MILQCKLMLIVILISLSGCAKDYNPWTTILNQLIKGNYGSNTIK